MKKTEEQTAVIEPKAITEPQYDPSETLPTQLEHFPIYNK